MNTFKLFTSIVLAGSVLATPALSAQRKTLFEVLFPKAHEERLKKQREHQLALQPPAEPVRVKTSRYYRYKVTPRTAINIKPLNVELASVGSVVETATQQNENIESQSVEVVSQSLMTSDLLNVGTLGLVSEKHLAKAISNYYSQHQEYVWISEQGEWNARARSVFRVFEDAEQYGLSPEDYQVDVNLTSEDPEKLESLKRISRDVAMTNAVLRYAMDASFGMIDPNRLSGYHDLPVHYGKTADVLEKILSKGLPSNTLLGMHPKSEKFENLKAELAALSDVEDDIIDLPTKILIKPGNINETLPLFIAAIKKRGSKELLEAHSTFLTGYEGGTSYTKEAVALVKAYQKEVRLGADGIIGRNTATKLAGLKSEDKAMQVKLAMERLRWLPKEFGARHVLINQPEYRARYVEQGEEKLNMRVVVGKKSNQTNFFYDEIEHVVYNPYWGVPRSIIVNEFLPKSLANPGYLDQSGYEITNTSGQRISSASIDWRSVGTYPKFNVRQPPGAKNALGNLKILFPNKHSIYMHDTPSKSLFKKQHRAFSHGCVRLHDPQAMAAAVLGKNKSQIKASIAAGKNQTEHLKQKVPVYVAYFTAWPQADGSVSYFRDVYGRDAHLLKAVEATRKARATNIAS